MATFKFLDGFYVRVIVYLMCRPEGMKERDMKIVVALTVLFSILLKRR